MKSSRTWEILLKPEESVDILAQWAYRKYFDGEKNQKKKYYDPSVNPQNVLDSFLKPNSPISPRDLVGFWRDLPGLQREFEKVSNEELKELETQLSSNNSDSGEPENQTLEVEEEEAIREFIKCLHSVPSSKEFIRKLLEMGMGTMELSREEEKFLDDLKLLKRKKAKEVLVNSLKEPQKHCDVFYTFYSKYIQDIATQEE